MGIKKPPRRGISWSAMRKVLEQDNICDSLKGRIQYFQTRYRAAHDQTPRVAVRFEGKEIFRSCSHDWWDKYYTALRRLSNNNLGNEKSRKEADYIAQWQGGVTSFYNSFYEYINNSIDKSLSSSDYVVRLFAILDKRVGKRRLERILPEVKNQPEWLQVFFKLRLEADGII
ncbi:MAG: hypothetical protein FWG90_13000 [Oscillospiraceae bacterium]|nr:hypothetical protein [Oscillospiraceae bacterium]